MNTTISYLITSVAFAFFVICPRMAGMAHIITKGTSYNLYIVTILGMLIAVPLGVAMVDIFGRYGLIAALAFCVLTDIASSLMIGKINLKLALRHLS